MPKQRKKRDLPVKTCTWCRRPFRWRKKWAGCWEEVQYCSKRCSGAARQARRSSES